MATPSEGAPALKYGGVNTETTSPDEVKGLIKKKFLEINSTYLLNPKLILIGKITLIPNFVKKGKILEKIPVRIVKNSS